MKKTRKPNRLREYDYSTPAAYFVTICENNRNCWFGNIIEGKMILNEFGLIAKFCWTDLPNHYLNIELDEYSIMPNHVHGVIHIIRNDNPVGNGLKPFQMGNDLKPFPMGNDLKPFPMGNDLIPFQMGDDLKPVDGINSWGGLKSRDGYKPSPTAKNHGLPEIIRGFKTFSSRRINETKPEIRFQWQKSYHDRIIRNEKELNRIRTYIHNNPANWDQDN